MLCVVEQIKLGAMVTCGTIQEQMAQHVHTSTSHIMHDMALSHKKRKVLTDELDEVNMVK